VQKLPSKTAQLTDLILQQQKCTSDTEVQPTLTATHSASAANKQRAKNKHYQLHTSSDCSSV